MLGKGHGKAGEVGLLRKKKRAKLPPRPNRSREQELREAANQFVGEAVSGGRLAQLRAKQLPKLLAKLCQRHPDACKQLPVG
jgi:hypothetical protein